MFVTVRLRWTERRRPQQLRFAFHTATLGPVLDDVSAVLPRHRLGASPQQLQALIRRRVDRRRRRLKRRICEAVR